MQAARSPEIPVPNGAVYSDSDIRVQGTVIVKDNKIRDAQANVYLDEEAKFADHQRHLQVQRFPSPMPMRQRVLQVLAVAEKCDSDRF